MWPIACSQSLPVPGSGHKRPQKTSTRESRQRHGKVTAKSQYGDDRSALYLAVQAHTGHVCRLDVFLEVSVVLGEFPGGNEYKVNLAHKSQNESKSPLTKDEVK